MTVLSLDTYNYCHHMGMSRGGTITGAARVPYRYMHVTVEYGEPAGETFTAVECSHALY